MRLQNKKFHRPPAKTGYKKTVARAFADKRGMAATEFALILPILSMIFFGMLEVSDAMMANRRVAHAANSLVDLVAQETMVTPDDVDDIIVGVRDMLDPTASSTLNISLVSVIVDPSDPDKIIVDWSRNEEGNEPYTEGQAYTKLGDDEIVHASASLVVVEMSYSYVTSLTSKVLGPSFQFDRIVSRWPRQSARVDLCDPSVETCS